MYWGNDEAHIMFICQLFMYLITLRDLKEQKQQLVEVILVITNKNDCSEFLSGKKKKKKETLFLLSRFYTVRYREKDKEKKWVFQLCPVTETVVDNLKPNTLYEFGVKDNMEDSVWSKTFNHKTVLSSKYFLVIM